VFVWEVPKNLRARCGDSRARASSDRQFAARTAPSGNGPLLHAPSAAVFEIHDNDHDHRARARTPSVGCSFIPQLQIMIMIMIMNHDQIDIAISYKNSAIS
jgi:hypothetical protein